MRLIWNRTALKSHDDNDNKTKCSMYITATKCIRLLNKEEIKKNKQRDEVVELEDEVIHCSPLTH